MLNLLTLHRLRIGVFADLVIGLLSWLFCSCTTTAGVSFAPNRSLVGVVTVIALTAVILEYIHATRKNNTGNSKNSN